MDVFAYDAWGDMLRDTDLGQQTPAPFADDADRNGTVDQTTGKVTPRLTSDNEVGYKGQYGYLTNPSTGLILAGQREYNPMQRRWMNRDPIGTAGGMNLYAYCGDDPVNEADPDGDQASEDEEGEVVDPAVSRVAKIIEERDEEVDKKLDEIKAHQFLNQITTTTLPETPDELRAEARLREAVQDFIEEPDATPKAWKRGDPIYQRTAAGNSPTWSTVRRRFWINESIGANAAAKYSPQNITRMSNGLAPQQYNKATGQMESMELHHTPIPQRDGGQEFEPLWPGQHAEVDSHRHLGY
jgi:RHS repeat-associated protein